MADTDEPLTPRPYRMDVQAKDPWPASGNQGTNKLVIGLGMEEAKTIKKPCCCGRYDMTGIEEGFVVNDYMHETIGDDHFCGPLYKHDLRDMGKEIDRLRAEVESLKAQLANAAEELENGNSARVERDELRFLLAEVAGKVHIREGERPYMAVERGIFEWRERAKAAEQRAETAEARLRESEKNWLQIIAAIAIQNGGSFKLDSVFIQLVDPKGRLEMKDVFSGFEYQYIPPAPEPRQ